MRLPCVFAVAVASACRSAPSASPDPGASALASAAAPSATSAPVAAVIASSGAPPLPAASSSLDVTSPRRFTAPPNAAGAEMMDEKSPWMSARLAKGRAGAPDLVRLPLHQHTIGWGCTCPFFYMGTEDTGRTLMVWLDPVFEKTATSPLFGETVVAEGYFTGKSHEEAGDGPTKYQVEELLVLRTRALTQPSDEVATVLALGEEASIEEPAPEDGRVFLVIVQSVPMGSAGAYTIARKQAEKLRAELPEVEVIDSRTVPGLFCCNYVVVVGRRATQAAAADLAAMATKAGQAPLVRKGW